MVSFHTCDDPFQSVVYEKLIIVDYPWVYEKSTREVISITKDIQTYSVFSPVIGNRAVALLISQCKYSNITKEIVD